MKPQRLIKTHRWKAFSIACQLAASAALATTYDLGTDWSDSANPNGPWSYNEGGNPLPHQNAWQGLAGDFTSAQPAWARGPVGNTNLPCWFKNSASVGVPHDWLTGDVVTHTTDNFNGVGSGPANVTWTSPGDGSITISGAVWMGRDIGRGNHWTLTHNGTTLAQGEIFSGDAYSRANPFNFVAGAGNPAGLTNRPVATGDAVKLQLDKTSPPGDYSGVILTINFLSSFQPQITMVEKLTNDLRLTFTSQSGRNYAVQSSSNLISAVWTTLPDTTNAATTNMLQTTLTNVFLQPQPRQFYRVWQLP